MKRLASGLLAIVGVAVLTGCASLTPAGEAVRLTTNQQATAGCKFLGNLKVANDDAKLRNQAAALGANVVYSYTRPEEFQHWQYGEAYLCSDEKGAPAR